MGTIERRQRQKTEVRSAILEAAWQLVKKEGWQALSIRRIAEAIEYSTPVIYDHFASKEAILCEFAWKGYMLLTEKMLEAKRNNPDPEKRLEAMALAYWNFSIHNEEFYQLMYGLGMPSCEVESRESDCECYDSLLLETIQEIIARGNNKEADAMLKYYTIWSMLHGLIAINRMKKAPASADCNARILKDAIYGFILGLKG